MDFPEYNFDAMNEADVREEIVAPLIRHLGYRAGTEHDVIREQALSYDRSQLGRTKSNDPPLRGRADYICVAGGRVRWVIEAKPPTDPLDQVAEAQAWSYANHPEVRAVFFVVTNGREFKLYETNRGPTSDPLMQCTYADLQAKLLKIENTLKPENILRDHPEAIVDPGEPLAPGLRSFARIVSGRMRATSITPAMGPITELVISITSGSVERSADGTLLVNYATLAPLQSLQQANVQLGLSEVQLVSTDRVISVDKDRPTVLSGARSIVIPRGMPMLNMLDWKTNLTPVDLLTSVTIGASGYISGHTFAGSYDSTLTMSGGPRLFQFRLLGDFEVQLT
ncbi:hypothetical protein C7T35_01390 [Variovorax sp. WS11]|uniref:type I restriction enzyme HsdR N-terminal domain-containing protein n=1 Tax=Variovorax sp. WS11 TaxID=1105204 RepID=UPI000D0E156B|nr:type I restriction enzyme HsdR N-terminal domain-containing protein [Variovorax sp. WS11]NDZ11494.1 type I restriction enzyme HsdR N-terminal domain-containing protein [Variovorax sp. WS11]PSL86648.1 hypothetical protein C7T35_01390 [Variovorax sp. WS11]